MPIHFTLRGDNVFVKYSGEYFEEYKAVIRSFDFVRFDVPAKAWTFPINMFQRIIPVLGTLPEPPEIEKALYERIVEDRAALERSKWIRNQQDSDFAPKGLNGKLLAFQKLGSMFLVQGRRAVLGDDVGLGKTVQAIGAFIHLLETEEIDSVLIICPGHLKRQWAAEIKKFSYWQPTIIDGSRVIREDKFKKGSQILITNYELLSRDPEYLAREWGAVVLDEAQNIKNYKTQAAKLTLELRAVYKWALTATPLENALPELHSIFNFVSPGFLGKWYEFERNFIVRDFWGKIIEYRNLDKLSEIIKPYLLRRRVEDCIYDFPPKESKVVFLDFLREEGIIYADIKKKVTSFLNEARSEQINKSNKMTQIGYLRQSCDHPLLISKEFNYSSAKIEWLKRVVAEIKNCGEKAVIFTEWSRMAKIIQRELGGCPILHGGMDFAARHETLEQWRETDESLVTTDCANVGLNLQQANWMISYELHWNPAVMKQRAGRVHRLTQKKPVHIRAPVIRASVEERVLEALSGKADLFKMVVDSLASQTRKVSRNDRGS